MRQIWKPTEQSIINQNQKSQDIQDIIDSIASLDQRISRDESSLANYKTELAGKLKDLVNDSIKSTEGNIANLSTVELTSIKAIIDELESPSASIDSLNSVAASITSIIANTISAGAADVQNITSDTATIADLSVTNLTVENPPHFDNFSADDITSDTATIREINTDDIQSDTLDVRSGIITELNTTIADVNKLNTQNADVDIAEINHILHNKEYQILEAGEYWVKLPKINNGEQRMIAVNSTTGLYEFSFEEFVSIRNQISRWSNRTAEPAIPFQIVDISIEKADTNSTYVHIKPLDTEYLYYISDDYDNRNQPTIYSDIPFDPEKVNTYEIVNPSATKLWYPIIFNNDESSTQPLTYHNTDDYDDAVEKNEHDTVYDTSEAKTFTNYLPDQDVNTDADVIHNSVTINKDPEDDTDNGTIRLLANGNIQAEGDENVDGYIQAGKYEYEDAEGHTVVDYATTLHANGDIDNLGDVRTAGVHSIQETGFISDDHTHFSRHFYIGPNLSDEELDEQFDDYALLIMEEEE